MKFNAQFMHKSFRYQYINFHEIIFQCKSWKNNFYTFFTIQNESVEQFSIKIFLAVYKKKLTSLIQRLFFNSKLLKLFIYKNSMKVFPTLSSSLIVSKNFLYQFGQTILCESCADSTN